MAENKKYYYMRLKENFFDSDEMLVLESLQDGYLYSNILLKLYLRSLRSNGKLMFKDTIPYSAQMIASITKHQIGTVERALKLFQEMGLIEILETGAIYMLDIQNYIGQASTEADRKREYREQIQREKSGFPALKDKCLDKCPDKSPPENRDKEIENRDYNNIYSLVDRKGDCKGENDLTQDKPAPGTSAGILPENGKGYRFSKDKSGEANSIPQDKSTGAKSDQAYPYAEIVEYLNRAAGTAFRPNSKDTKKYIRARFKDGFTLADFKTVIDKKAKEWGKIPAPGQQDMRPYLRPSTLFGTKFESYLNQPDTSEHLDFSDYRNFKPSTQGGTGNEAYKHFKPSR